MQLFNWVFEGLEFKYNSKVTYKLVEVAAFGMFLHKYFIWCSAGCFFLSMFLFVMIRLSDLGRLIFTRRLPIAPRRLSRENMCRMDTRRPLKDLRYDVIIIYVHYLFQVVACRCRCHLLIDLFNCKIIFVRTPVLSFTSFPNICTCF